MSDNLKHTENLLTNVDDKLKLNNDKLDSVILNTANIKASIEVGGDLYVSQDQVEAKLDTIITNTGGSSSSSSTHTALLTDIQTNTANNTLILAKNTQIRDENLTRNTTLNSMNSRLTDIETNTALNSSIHTKLTQVRDEGLIGNSSLVGIKSKLDDIDTRDNTNPTLTLAYQNFSSNPATQGATDKQLLTRDYSVSHTLNTNVAPSLALIQSSQSASEDYLESVDSNINEIIQTAKIPTQEQTI